MRKLLLPLLALLTLPMTISAQTPNASPAAPSPAVQIDRGINLGNFLEAPHEGDWGQKLQADDFSIIKQAGFNTVRVPICWSSHVTAQPPYTIDPTFMNRIDWVVAQAKANGLQAILDYHNDNALMKDPDTNADRFVAIWQQIAEHFKDQPPSILFELLNEPNGKLDALRWNALLTRTLSVIRVDNPDRAVVVGPVSWNSYEKLPKLMLPDTDRNLIVTFHYYDPFHFTHQGASWVDGSDAWLGTTWQGTDGEKEDITEAFDQAAAWGKENQRPIYLGEFGAFSRSPIEERACWTAFVARTAEARGFAWSYWEFSSGFGAYDPKAHQWRAPLLNALLPKR